MTDAPMCNYSMRGRLVLNFGTKTAERAQAERDQREVLGRRAQVQQQLAELVEVEQTAQAAVTREVARSQKCSEALEHVQVRAADVSEEKEQLQDERSQLHSNSP